MRYQVSRAFAAGRSLWKRAEPAAEGAGLDVGLLGRRGCGVLASPSGFGDLERRERVGARRKRGREGRGGDRRGRLLGCQLDVRPSLPSACHLLLAPLSGFQRRLSKTKQPERDSETARRSWPQRRSNICEPLGQPCQQQDARMGEAESDGEVLCAQRAHNK
jgi:hypothetical protein